MGFRLSEEQIDDLLIYCNTQPRIWKNGECLVCCPVHGESHPSMGISEEKQIVHCFSCGFAGDFSKMLMYSLPDEFGLDTETDDTTRKTSFKAYRKAKEFIAERYELEYREIGKRTRSIRRYGSTKNDYLKDDEVEVLPKYKIAPFMSGKETYNYFFSRGFTKSDMQEYMIGRDLENETVTIPVFDKDGSLLGVIGRYISTKRLKNQRYKIYFNFDRGDFLYPLNKAEPIDGVVILVEGQFDAIRMHKLGYTNTYASMTVSISKKQAEWLCNNCECVIWLGDNDKRGLEGREKAKELLKNKIDFKVVDYPNHGKDVCDWTDDEIHKMIKGARGQCVRKLKRL